MEITSEIIRQIIDDLKADDTMIDCEKADVLSRLCYYMYVKQSKPFKKEIDKLLDKWD